MPANVYECMFLLDTNKVAGDQAAAARQLHTILEKNNAEVLVSRPWEERRLAYPIGAHKKGLYFLVYFRTEGKNLATIEHDFKLNETILRSLILNIDPKLVDSMLEVARDERVGVALQTVNEPPDAEDIGREGEMDRGPRRSPRRERSPAGAGAGAGAGSGPPPDKDE
jgi:small subunit ribosomal protein S6